MRITNSMMTNQFLADANANLSRVSHYQEQVSSTKRVSHISDDPEATITALRARNKLSGLDMYQKNIKTAGSYLKEAESAADELNDVLQSVYENIVDAANGDMNDDNMAAIADEISCLQEEIVSVGNSTVGSAYLFGGFNFTGSTGPDGTKSAPFSVDAATGHLIYNGIDMTQISSADDYDNYTDLMSRCADVIGQSKTELAATTSDQYARDTVCAKAQDTLKSLLANCKAAMSAAEKFGIDASMSTGYQQLSDFTDALTGMNEDLSNECSKQLSDGDAQSSENCFSISNAQELLDSIDELIGNTDTTSGVGLDYSMADAAAQLGSEMEAVLTASGAKDALEGEAGNRAKIQIGVDNTVEYTFTGLDLLGSGKNNVYYMLDKCVSMLRSGDSAGLKGMISEVQDSQSSVLSLETKIGATENRLDLINSRYDSSTQNYTEVKSDAIDADMAESITNLMTAKTVYNAALAAGSELVQTSLLDFLR